MKKIYLFIYLFICLFIYLFIYAKFIYSWRIIKITSKFTNWLALSEQ